MAKIGFRPRHALLASNLLGCSLFGVSMLAAFPAGAQNAESGQNPSASGVIPTSPGAPGAVSPTSTSTPNGAAPAAAPVKPSNAPVDMTTPHRTEAAKGTGGRARVEPGGRSLAVEAGSGVVVNLGSAAANIFVADPKVAEVRPASATSLFVFGVAPGRTTIAAMDSNGKVMTQYALTVRPSSFGAGEASGNIGRAIRGGDVHVTANANGLVMSGHVPSAADADQASTMAKGFMTQGQTLENHLSVTSSSIVGLHVKIAEMNRAVERQLGVSWSALGTLGSIGAFPALAGTLNGLSAASCTLGAVGCRGAGFQGVLEALATDGLIRTLAEPNLTARSGEAANFLVGGEYPIPISQQFGTTTVEYKQYGVALSFVPTVLSNGRISLHVRPEVSQLSSAGATSVGSITIPALTVRRAETTIELGSGESFAIAGLLQDSTTQSDSSIPGLGDIPVIGALFRSDSFQHNQTELVIIVTPYLVTGATDPQALRLPTDNYKAPNDIERLLWLRQQGVSSAPGVLPSSVARIPGSAGFVLQ